MIEFINTIDISIIHAVQSLGPSWYIPAWFLSFVTDPTKWFALASVVALFLIGKKRTALELCVIFAISVVVIFGLKHFIDAPRPYWVDFSVTGYVSETDSGMPSAHALLAVVIFGWLWLRHPKSYILSIGGGTLAFCIGLSRIFLGVHYPSQVVVGWALGFLILWAFWWMDKAYFRPRSSYVEKAKRGFTLIELLVVIAIVGILSSVVLASLNTARIKGSDAALKSQLAAIRPQAEIVYDTLGNYGAQQAPGACPTTAGNTLFSTTTPNNVFNQVTAALKNAGGSGGGGSSRCVSSGSPATSWGMIVVLKSANTSAWCVDSSGASKPETIPANNLSSGISDVTSLCN